jgi:hypothetical protein
VRSFKQAWRAKNVNALMGLLDSSVTAIADGGSLASAALDPSRATRMSRSTSCCSPNGPGRLDLIEGTVHGKPGLVTRDTGVTVAVHAFEVAAGRIQRMWVVRNPEKLRTWA